jgi:mitochondrial enoyl-[acyl-carrier protein] reductase / trans-2-enoyl-CoA reductase
MLAVQVVDYGKPWDVVRTVEATEPPSPPAGQIKVKLLASPIHPADLLLMRGHYGKRPPLPTGMGGEGVASVVDVSAGTDFKRGDRVIIPYGHDTWVDHLTISANRAVKVPAGIDDAQASMALINPFTARLMLTDFVDLAPGEFVIQNAANSGVGRAVIAIARARGLRTVNVVRRLELIDELKAAGGDVVLADGPDLPKRVAEATGKASIRLGLEGVAGEAMRSLTGTVAEGGTLVVYAGMSAQPAVAFPPHLIFRDLTIRGFWLIKWFRSADPKLVAEIQNEVLPLIADGSIKVPVEHVYPLSSAREAISHAARAKGKILFTAS